MRLKTETQFWPESHLKLASRGFLSRMHQPGDPEGRPPLYLVQYEFGLLSNQTFLGSLLLCGGALHAKFPELASGDPQEF